MRSALIFAAAVAPFANAVRIVQSNDDGWAEINARTLFNSLTAAGNQVVLSGPAENQSGTGTFSPGLPPAIAKSHMRRFLGRNTQDCRLRRLPIQLLPGRSSCHRGQCHRPAPQLCEFVPSDIHQARHLHHRSCPLERRRAPARCHGSQRRPERRCAGLLLRHHWRSCIRRTHGQDSCHRFLGSLWGPHCLEPAHADPLKGLCRSGLEPHYHAHQLRCSLPTRRCILERQLRRGHG